MIKFDEDSQAIINPTGYKIEKFPKIGIMVFDDRSYPKIIKDYDTEIINKEVESCFCNYKGYKLYVFHASCGAPMAAVDLELAIASGVNTVVAFGIAGTLDKNIKVREITLPTSAIREEGTSYHYIANGDEIVQDKTNLEILKEIIKKYNLSFTEGKVWTTDAIYRETKNKMVEMKKRGCIAVDMECSANLAVAQFRKINFVQFLTAADNLDSYEHDTRLEERKITYNDKIINIAFDSAITMYENSNKNKFI
jgi:purine-nucleoside phosphorylase